MPALGLAVLLTVAVAVPGVVPAGDVAAIKVLGFSADGRRFAILQSGVEDGSGRAYARLDVVAAGGREALRREVVLEEGREPAAARTALLAAADGELARLGIVVAAAEAGPAVTAVDSLPGVARALIGEGREVAIEL
jgi:predicted secreted protein